jgi:hypothetical protein
MRLALLASSAVALAALSGCGGSSAPPEDGAWFVSMVSDTGMCSLADIMSKTGLVTDQSKQMTIENGMSNLSLDCSVTQGTGKSFAVAITAQDTTPSTGSTLQFNIPSISPSATQASPATGTVSYSSAATVDEEYASHACNFYFSSKSEGVALGQIWVTFDCPMITNGAAMSTCDMQTSYAIFENCLTM